MLDSENKKITRTPKYKSSQLFIGGCHPSTSERNDPFLIGRNLAGIFYAVWQCGRCETYDGQVLQKV